MCNADGFVREHDVENKFRVHPAPPVEQETMQRAAHTESSEFSPTLVVIVVVQACSCDTAALKAARFNVTMAILGVGNNPHAQRAWTRLCELVRSNALGASALKVTDAHLRSEFFMFVFACVRRASNDATPGCFFRAARS